MAERSITPSFDILEAALAPIDLSGIDFDDLEDFQLSPKQNCQRFGTSVQQEDIDATIYRRVPLKTKHTTKWAYSVWSSWCKARCVNPAINTMSLSTMDAHLTRFIMEARKQDGTEYPPNTLYQLICGLQRYLKENGRPEVALLDEKRQEFDKTRKVLDGRMKELTAKGVGTVTKSAQPLTSEQENELWSKNIFTIHTAEGLLKAVFWYNCKCFGLRGGDEHRELVREQYSIGYDGVGRYLRFMGRSSKNVQGGLKQRAIKPKDLKIYAKPELGERCVVDIFSSYMACIPSKGPFYRRPIKDASPPRFSQQVVGKHTLGTIVKRFCAEAGFQGNYTNHSGKVTCATTLFNQNFDEQLIQRQTGHRSNAVRIYKRPSQAQDLQISHALQPSTSSSPTPSMAGKDLQTTDGRVPPINIYFTFNNQ